MAAKGLSVATINGMRTALSAALSQTRAYNARPVISRAITNRWISAVPSQIW
jgi:hypothetical protein